jgi:cation diffusion facilitator CzcD-associated flavoprotein CzcO
VASSAAASPASAPPRCCGRAGVDDVTVFERSERVGGVWHANTYPGAACDVPSHLYEFSFAPNPRWSRRYAPQPEIQAYLEDVARRHGVLDASGPAPR